MKNYLKTPTASCILGLALFLARGTALAQMPNLPFTMTATQRTEGLPEYVAPPRENLYNSTPNFKVGWGIDSPIGFVRIDGEVWTIFNLGNQYQTTVKVARFQGADFEHTVRQPDGTIMVEKGVSTHFCGGMWYDQPTGVLYAPIHCEYARQIQPPAGWCRKKTRLATSSDKGLTWQLGGDILTDCLPADDDWLKFSGSYFEAGPGDFDFYADSLGGYFYIFSCNAYAPKDGPMNNFLWFNEVARCAMSDKMAPGKWWKYCNGTWAEPGLGGRSSRVCMGSTGIYGRVIYSRSLQKYLRIGNCLGVIDKRYTSLGFTDGSIVVSACSDLSRQDWTPLAKLLDDPGNNKFGYTVADGSAADPFTCDRTFRIYNYWLYNLPSRAVDVVIGHGSTPFAGWPRYSSYAYEPLPESGDPIVSRKTELVECSDRRMRYGGDGWRLRRDSTYFGSEARESSVPGNSVEYTFRGGEIYWRAAADTDGGRAEVYLDGRLEETVDCFYRDPLPLQFAFMRVGLDPGVMHTIRAVVRPDRDPRSRGNVIRHIAFEASAESYRASAGFSSVAGKNNWWYKGRDGAKLVDLPFHDFIVSTAPQPIGSAAKEHRVFANFWGLEAQSVVANCYQVPGGLDAVRAWMAPHDGMVHIEGTARLADSGGIAAVRIMLGDTEVWPLHELAPGGSASHAFQTKVKKGDLITFIAGKNVTGRGIKVFWDPLITYDKNFDPAAPRGQ